MLISNTLHVVSVNVYWCYDFWTNKNNIQNYTHFEKHSSKQESAPQFTNSILMWKKVFYRGFGLLYIIVVSLLWLNCSESFRTCFTQLHNVRVTSFCFELQHPSLVVLFPYGVFGSTWHACTLLVPFPNHRESMDIWIKTNQWSFENQESNANKTIRTMLVIVVDDEWRHRIVWL